MPRVVHFEIPADEPERAVEFYSKVFDWKTQKWEGAEDYWVLTTGNGSQPGIDGGLMKRTSQYPNPVNSIAVPSVDDYINKVTSAGGQVLTSKITIPGVGYIAYFKDTEGNTFGLFQDDESAR
jgi:predicted enzyme related to lactoylglutathione lyase